VTVSGKSKRQLVEDAVREQADLPGRLIAGEWRFAHAALLDWLGIDA
jgi:hypothetical protein